MQFTPNEWFMQFAHREPDPREAQRIAMFSFYLDQHVAKARKFSRLLHSDCSLELLRALFIQHVFEENLKMLCLASATGAVHGPLSSPFYLLAEGQPNRPLRVFLYREADVLGHGRVRTVYKAIDVERSRLEAVGRTVLNTDDETVEMEIDMQRAVSELFFYAIQESSVLYTALPIANAGTLHRPKIRSISPQIIYELTLKVISAVARVHEQRIVIADLNESNILLHIDLRLIARINDFSLAFYEGTSEEHRLTTPNRKAPEQCDSATYLKNCKVTQKTDMFQLGLLLWIFVFKLYPPAYKPHDFTDYPKRWSDMSQKFVGEPLETLLCDLLAPYPKDRPTAQKAEINFLEILARL